VLFPAPGTVFLGVQTSTGPPEPTTRDVWKSAGGSPYAGLRQQDACQGAHGDKQCCPTSHKPSPGALVINPSLGALVINAKTLDNGKWTVGRHHEVGGQARRSRVERSSHEIRPEVRA
jgi:hypothetical protein